MGTFKTTTTTIGTSGDVGFIISGQFGIGYAKDNSDDRNRVDCLYHDRSIGLGASVGSGGGLAIGVWQDKPSDLDGYFWGIEMGAALGAGVGFGVYFKKTDNEDENIFTSMTTEFLGFTLFLVFGIETEINFVLSGKTDTFGHTTIKATAIPPTVNPQISIIPR